jgi:hypothetical protein
MGNFDAPTAPSVLSGTHIPTLREPPPADSAAAGHSYLVTRRETIAVARRILLSGGGVRYAFDQLNNPDSIEMTPGSWHPSEALLHGRISTCSDTSESRELFAHFKRAIGKHFRKINAFWVGPEAEAAWKQGARLTIGLSSPREYDLRELTSDAV